MAVEFRHSVVLLGSTSGMVRATAGAYAAAGYALILAARDDEENGILAADLAVRHNVPCHALHFDGADVESHEAFVTECEAVLGTKPTGLILGFGYMAEQAVAQRDMAETRAMIDTNLTGVFNCCQAAMPHLAEGATIINVASLSAVTGFFGQANYASAKAGVITLTKVLCKELARQNIRVNAVAPGVVDTEMGKSIPEENRQAMIKMVPLGRFAEPREIGDVILFLASDLSSYVTGQTIHINGGWV